MSKWVAANGTRPPASLAHLSGLSAVAFAGPVTSLVFFCETVVVCGFGPQLCFFNTTTGKLLHVIPNALPAARIHGIRVCQVPPTHTVQQQSPGNTAATASSTTRRLVLFGQKLCKLIQVTLHHDAAPTKARSHRLSWTALHELLEMSDWILDAVWLDCNPTEHDATATAATDTSALSSLSSSSSSPSSPPVLVALAFAHSFVQVWDWRTATCLLHVQCAVRCINYCARFFGRTLASLRLASGTVFNSVLVWKPFPSLHAASPCAEPVRATAPVSFECKGHDGVIFGVNFDANGDLLASVSDDRSIRVWVLPADEPDTHRILQPRSISYGHVARIWSAQFFSRGLISVSEDSTCKVWRADGSLWKELKGNDGKNVWSLALCESAERSVCFAVTGTENGTVRLWTVPLSDDTFDSPSASSLLPRSSQAPLAYKRQSFTAARENTTFGEGGLTWTAPLPPTSFPLCGAAAAEKASRPIDASSRSSSTAYTPPKRQPRPRLAGDIKSLVLVSASLVLACNGAGELFGFDIARKTFQLLIPAPQRDANQKRSVLSAAVFASAVVASSPATRHAAFVFSVGDGSVHIGLLEWAVGSDAFPSIAAMCTVVQRNFSAIQVFFPDNHRCAKLDTLVDAPFPIFLTNARAMNQLEMWTVEFSLRTSPAGSTEYAARCDPHASLVLGPDDAHRPTTVCHLPDLSLLLVHDMTTRTHIFDLALLATPFQPSEPPADTMPTTLDAPSTMGVRRQKQANALLHARQTAALDSGAIHSLLPTHQSTSVSFGLHERGKRITHLVRTHSRQFCSVGIDGHCNFLSLQYGPVAGHPHVSVSPPLQESAWFLTVESSRQLNRDRGCFRIVPLHPELGCFPYHPTENSLLAQSQPPAAAVVCFGVNHCMVVDLVTGQCLARAGILKTDEWDFTFAPSANAALHPWLLCTQTESHALKFISSTDEAAGTDPAPLLHDAHHAVRSSAAPRTLLKGFHHREIRGVSIIDASCVPQTGDRVVLFSSVGEDTMVYIGCCWMNAASGAVTLHRLTALSDHNSSSHCVQSLSTISPCAAYATHGRVDHRIMLTGGNNSSIIAWKIATTLAHRQVKLLTEATPSRSSAGAALKHASDLAEATHSWLHSTATESDAASDNAFPVVASKFALCPSKLLGDDNLLCRVKTMSAVPSPLVYGDFYLLAATADGFIRFLSLSAATSSFHLLLKSGFHGRCPLAADLICIDFGASYAPLQRFALVGATGATDGRIALWDFSQSLHQSLEASLEASPGPLAVFRAHQSGVNALKINASISTSPENEPLATISIVSGGDDNAVAAAALLVTPSAPASPARPLLVRGLRAALFEFAHSSSVTSVQLFEQSQTMEAPREIVFASSSTDQRLNVWSIGMDALCVHDLLPRETPLGQVRSFPLPAGADHKAHLQSSCFVDVPDVCAMDSFVAASATGAKDVYVLVGGIGLQMWSNVTSTA